MGDDILHRLAEKSGSFKSDSSTRIPTVKLDGSAAGGHIMKFNDGATDLGTEGSIQIIRVKKKLMSSGELSKYFSDEYDSSSDTVTLKLQTRADDKSEWSKPTPVATGTATDIRVNYDVKTAFMVYGIMNGELVKMIVKGASLMDSDGFIEYLNSFSKSSGDLFFRYNTLISVSLVQKNRAVSYHRMHFRRGQQITNNMDKVEAYLDIVNGTDSTNTPTAVQPMMSGSQIGTITAKLELEDVGF